MLTQTALHRSSALAPDHGAQTTCFSALLCHPAWQREKAKSKETLAINDCSHAYQVMPCNHANHHTVKQSSF